MKASMTLDRLSDDELLRRLDELVSHSRRVEVDLVAHIGEVERRRLYAREASPSMFAYCRERLHLSEAEAYMRIRVARAARWHPLLLDMLRDGRLHLSGIVRLLPELTCANREALLTRATFCSKRQILELVAELSPRPDVPARMVKLPQQRQSLLPSIAQPLPALPSLPSLPSLPASPALPTRAALAPAAGASASAGVAPSQAGVASSQGRAEAAAGAAADPQSDRAGVQRVDLLCPDTVAAASAPTPNCLDPQLSSEERPGGALVSSPTRRTVVEPLSPGRYRVQFTASVELHDKLERLRALMRSQVPDGDLAVVIDHAVSETLARLEARRFAKTTAPRRDLSDTSTAPASRHVPAAVKRAVRERDGDRCGFVDTRGRLCSERDRLEFHHRYPFGMGGDHDPGNVGLLCRAHNQLLARSDYGLLATTRRDMPRAGASPCEVPPPTPSRTP